MMRGVAVLLASTTVLENMGAFPHASALKAPTFLAAEDVPALLAAEIRQDPQNPPNLKKSPIGIFIFLAIVAAFGSIFGCAGVGMSYASLRSRQEAALMTGDDALEATATITSRKTYTTTSTSTDSDGTTSTSTQHHYEASYWFEAVRVDGMRCRITVTDRELGSKVLWESCSEGSRQQVAYLGDDPQHCRLTQAAESDKKSAGGFFFVLQLLFGLVFAAAGFSVGVVEGTKALGLYGFLICASVWCGLVFCCMHGCIGPAIDIANTAVKDASLEELGMQEPSSELGNISGAWSLQSDLGTFEYKFATVNEKAFSLTVQGRLEGQIAWDPEYEARFTDGRTMKWEDDQGTTFRVTFENAQRFGGRASSTNGSELAFVGVRKN